MPSPGLEAALQKALPIHTVGELEKFPFKTYPEFLKAVEDRRVELLTAFDPGAVTALGSGGDKALHYAMTWSPFLAAVGCVVAAFVLPSFMVLLGVPLAFLGMFLSLPGFMRSIGIWLNRFLLILLIYLWTQGDVTASLLVLSYVGPNFLCHAARHHCRMVLVRAATQSELVLVWLFRKDSLVPVLRAAQQA